MFHVFASHSRVSLSLQSMRSSGTTCPASPSTVTRSFISGKERKGKEEKKLKFDILLFCTWTTAAETELSRLQSVPCFQHNAFTSSSCPVWATKPAKPNLLVEDQMLIYVSFSAVCKWLSLSGLFLCLLHLYMQYL